MTKEMEQGNKDVNTSRYISDQITRLTVDISYIKRDVQQIKDKIEHDNITRAEFEPIKRTVYGLIGLILVSFVGALMAIVLK